MAKTPQQRRADKAELAAQTATQAATKAIVCLHEGDTRAADNWAGVAASQAQIAGQEAQGMYEEPFDDGEDELLWDILKRGFAAAAMAYTAAARAHTKE